MSSSFLCRSFAITASCLALLACSDDSTATTPSSSTSSSGGSSSGGSSSGGSSSGGGDAATGSEAPASCLPLLQPKAGVYPVTGTAVDPVARGTSTGTHQRGNVVVAADGAIDFDTGQAQTAKSITECYDRTKQDTDRRIQVSYGPDDNALVINLYLSAAGVVEEIQRRDRANNVNVRVLVGAPTK